MATISTIRKLFEDLNIPTSTAVLEKSLEICENYNIDPEDFQDQWIAYTTSNLNGAPPSVEELIKMERKEYQNHSKDTKFIKKPTTPKTNYRDNSQSNLLENENGPSTPKSNRNLKHVQTPENQRLHSMKLNYDTPDINIYSSPATSKTQSDRYSQRTDSRSVQCTFGNSAKFERENDISFKIKLEGEDNNSYMTHNVKYMFEIMGRKAKILDSITDWLGNGILKKYNLTANSESFKNNVGQMITYGRIVSDSYEKINAQSVLLEGTRSLNMAHTVRLNIDKLPKCSIFPGQVVVVEGINLHTGVFSGKNIYTDASPFLPLEPPLIDSPLQIIVASGPFTLPGNVNYEPLNDLIKYILENKPHLVILTGPFLEKENESIHNGTLTESFDIFFESIIQTLMDQLEGIDTQVVIVSSFKDAHHHPVYPTPPYNIRQQYPNLKFVPDPSLLNINGLIIGITTADILFDISMFEFHQDKYPSGATDRIARLVTHLFQQQSFYPLYPPNTEMFLDHELLEQFGFIEVIPHMLILPSNLRHFIKNINGCLVINPERSTKGYGAGTFARIEVNPGESNSICSRSSCQILRI